MTKFTDLADQFIAAYNAKDFDKMDAMVAPDLDFAHFNRGFALNSSKELLDIMHTFGRDYFAERQFHPPERVTAAGNVVIREAQYSGTVKVDLPGFADAGGSFDLRLCTVLRFNDDGIIVEWKDHG